MEIFLLNNMKLLNPCPLSMLGFNANKKHLAPFFKVIKNIKEVDDLGFSRDSGQIVEKI